MDTMDPVKNTLERKDEWVTSFDFMDVLAWEKLSQKQKKKKANHKFSSPRAKSA